MDLCPPRETRARFAPQKTSPDSHRMRRQPVIHPIDWPELILDLVRTGMSLSAIAAECGYDEETRAGKEWLVRLRNTPGTQPKFHPGAMLVGLWAERMSRPASEVPRDSLERLRNDSGRARGLALDVKLSQTP